MYIRKRDEVLEKGRETELNIYYHSKEEIRPMKGCIVSGDRNINEIK